MGDSLLKKLKFLLATTAAVAFIAPARAADMPVKAPRAVPAAVYSWTGFYVGGNIGAVWAHDDDWTATPADATSAAAFVPCTAAGTCPFNRPGDRDTSFICGLQIGYNWQVQSFVIGVEADIQGSNVDISRTITINTGNAASSGFHRASAELDWLATVRGRLGVLVSPTALAYVTGGWAYGRVDRSYGANSFNNTTRYSGTSRRTDHGWTVGGGLELGWASNWTIGAEYLYVRLQGGQFLSQFEPPPPLNICDATNCNLNVSPGDLQLHIARLKLNYRFGGPVVARY
jgi:outer membrane immunogenic protein